MIAPIPHTMIMHTSMESMMHDVGASNGVTPTHLSDKFQSLMQQTPTATVEPAGGHAGDVVSKFATYLDSELQWSTKNSHEFARRAPTMNMRQMTTESVYLMNATASVNLDMSETITLISAAKSAIETLIKNQ